jgi:hypothetical protein
MFQSKPVQFFREIIVFRKSTPFTRPSSLHANKISIKIDRFRDRLTGIMVTHGPLALMILSIGKTEVTFSHAYVKCQKSRDVCMQTKRVSQHLLEERQFEFKFK